MDFQQAGNHHHTASVQVAGLGPYDVLCGRDKAAFNATGNRRFRVTIELMLERYVTAKTRDDKSLLIFSTIDLVHSNGGRFIKRQNNRWVELSEHACRQKVGHALRDMSMARVKVDDGATPSSSPTSTRKKRAKRKLFISSKSHDLTPPARAEACSSIEDDHRHRGCSSSVLPRSLPAPALVSHSTHVEDVVAMTSSLPTRFACLTTTGLVSQPSSPALAKPSVLSGTTSDELRAALSDTDRFNVQLDSDNMAFENLFDNGLDLKLRA